MAGKMTICAYCGCKIGDDVAAIRPVRLQGGGIGWITLHVRCAMGARRVATRCMAKQLPEGQPLQLAMIAEGVH